ncbi:MAG: hypothetical protein P4L64_16280 [Caulobacteraceae bacterium]|nr:hypothetical protein [Caulobacteraceae bacterium]
MAADISLPRLILGLIAGAMVLILVAFAPVLRRMAQRRVRRVRKLLGKKTDVRSDSPGRSTLS